MSVVRGFVSHAFDEAAYDGGRAAFRERIKALVDDACADFADNHISVASELFFEETAYGSPLMPGVRSQIRSCDFLIADITQTDLLRPVNPNVMYEIGYAMALEKEVVVMRRNADPPPPSDIGDLLAGTYEDLQDIPVKFRARMIDVVTKTLARAHSEASRIDPLIWKVWFPPETRQINIVCTRELEPSRFSDGHEPNYVRIDRFEDRDALLELSTFFARRYPQASVISHLADEMPNGTRDCDLVVLGGPGCEPGEGNCLAVDLIGMTRSQVRYPPSGEGLEWGSEALRPTKYEGGDDTKGVLSDWGSILAAPNPYNPSARVILIHGTTTYGTLGAALAFIDTQQAIKNYLCLAGAKIENRLTGSIDFEAVIQIEVDSGRRVKPPKLQPEDIRRINS